MGLFHGPDIILTAGAQESNDASELTDGETEALHQGHAVSQVAELGFPRV